MNQKTRAYLTVSFDSRTLENGVGLEVSAPMSESMLLAESYGHGPDADDHDPARAAWVHAGPAVGAYFDVGGGAAPVFRTIRIL